MIMHNNRATWILARIDHVTIHTITISRILYTQPNVGFHSLARAIERIDDRGAQR
jgi:hypothetical protein